MPTPATTIDVEGREIRVSNPDKVLFPQIGATKMELVEYYLTVAGAALIGCRDRPTIMHRFPNGADGCWNCRTGRSCQHESLGEFRGRSGSDFPGGDRWRSARGIR